MKTKTCFSPAACWRVRQPQYQRTTTATTTMPRQRPMIFASRTRVFYRGN